MLSKFSRGQLIYFASAIKTISEGIILGSSGAFFLPETFQLQRAIAINRYVLLFLLGLILLFIGAILEKRSEL
jgi:hypothetical protein